MRPRGTGTASIFATWDASTKRCLKLNAQELDPLSIVINTNVAQVYLAKGDATSAIEQAKKVIELDPNYPGGHRILAQAYAKQGQYAEALSVLQKAVASSGRATEYQSYQTY